MIQIEEIPVERIDEFWEIPIRYLLDDGLIDDEEDEEYFRRAQYRDLIKAHMLRPVDKHHMVYCVRNGVRIGAAQYNTYQSEDGKCFILDYWVFPEFQRKGIGTALLRSVLNRYSHVRQIELATGNTPKTTAFYKSMGFREMSEIGCCGFFRG